jgi:hypothetical protein
MSLNADVPLPIPTMLGAWSSSMLEGRIGADGKAPSGAVYGTPYPQNLR